MSAPWVPVWLHPVWERLAHAEASGRLPHAILLDGPPGWGKRFLARQLARSLTHLPPRDPATMLFGEDASDGDLLAHRDVRIVARGVADSGRLRRQILIEQVRELGEFLVRTAGSGGRRIAIVELAEDLNVNAANALLKRLEEPGSGCHLILVSHRISEVLPTIRSRCQRLAVAPGSRDAARAWLGQQLPGEVDAGRMLQLVGGAPLLARERADSELPLLADAVDAFLSGAPADALIKDDRDRADLVLELLYRAVARNVRAEAQQPPARALHFLERISRARRLLGSQSNPNVTLLLEDLLLGSAHLAGGAEAKAGR
ncbi:MAG: AAA family ATPase [Gammaproteobacteria bacterium]|nr:AAA family ATPase [Gammaproteobacteria bacterium]